MTHLESKYFKTLSSTTEGLTTYQCIAPPNGSMILFSRKDNTPLAILSVKARDAATAVAERPDSTLSSQKFQALVTKNEQKISLIITNPNKFFQTLEKLFIFNRDGWINFNILRTPEATVNCKDPGPSIGVNRVNELKPGDSYEVKCDQATGRLLSLENN